MDVDSSQAIVGSRQWGHELPCIPKDAIGKHLNLRESIGVPTYLKIYSTN